MILRKDGVNLMETADKVPGKVQVVPDVPKETQELFEGQLITEPNIVITLSGEMANRVSNIEVYFKEDKDEIR